MQPRDCEALHDNQTDRGAHPLWSMVSAYGQTDGAALQRQCFTLWHSRLEQTAGHNVHSFASEQLRISRLGELSYTVV